MKIKINDLRERKPSIFKFGYIKDLVGKKKYPICGVRRGRPNWAISGRREDPNKIYHVNMQEQDWKKFSEINWGQPFEIFWDYNAIRKDMRDRGIVNKYGRVYNGKPLPLSRAIVKGYISMSGQAVENSRNNKMYYWVTTETLDKFQVFKQAKIARYKKKHMA